jgi:cytochrome c peroxidase
LDRALIYVQLEVPADAEFEVVSVANPYGCDNSSILSVYRRPMPTTNLRFLSTLMWDGRESSTQTGTQKITFATNPGDLLADLAHQALDVTNGHAQGSAPLTEQRQKDIVDFEMGLVTAQAFDYRAGPLDAKGAFGGPVAIAQCTVPDFFIGINDPLGGNPRNVPFTPVIFGLFDTWMNSGSDYGHTQNEQRTRIARGQALFNSKPISITGVAGLNDDLNQASIPGTAGPATTRST